MDVCAHLCAVLLLKPYHLHSVTYDYKGVNAQFFFKIGVIGRSSRYCMDPLYAIKKCWKNCSLLTRR